MSEKCTAHSFHQLCPPQGGEPQQYRVTHHLNEDGGPIGSGIVEIEETVVHPGGRKEKKFRPTNANYEQFMHARKQEYDAQRAAEQQLQELDDKQTQYAVMGNCESCGAPATTREFENVPLCAECYEAMKDDEPPATTQDAQTPEPQDMQDHHTGDTAQDEQ